MNTYAIDQIVKGSRDEWVRSTTVRAASRRQAIKSMFGDHPTPHGIRIRKA